MPASNPLGAPVQHREVVWLPGGTGAHETWNRNRRMTLFRLNKRSIKAGNVNLVELYVDNLGEDESRLLIKTSTTTEEQPIGDPWQYVENDPFLETFDDLDPIEVVSGGHVIQRLELAADVLYLLLEVDNDPETGMPGGNFRVQVASSNEKQLL